MKNAARTSVKQVSAIKIAALCVIRMNALIGYGHVAGKDQG